MLSRRCLSARVLVVVVVVLLAGGTCFADWATTVWEDDFDDGDITNNPTWTTFVGPGGGVSTPVPLMGPPDYYLMQGTGYYGAPLEAGWAGAYVAALEGDQGMSGWLRPFEQAADDVIALSLLRYTPTAAFGTGYGLGITFNAQSEMVARFYRLDDTAASEIGDEVLVQVDYDDMLFRFLATGAGANTQLQARVWADGAAEPGDWLLDATLPGGAYDTGYGGVGIVTLNSEVQNPVVFFNDVKYGTPEPTTMVLLATGIGALALRRRRKV